MTIAIKHVALIKGEDKYKWGVYNGPTLTMTSKQGVTFKLKKGEKFGARMSSNKKDVRVVFEALGLTKVFTLPADILTRIYKNAKEIKQL